MRAALSAFVLGLTLCLYSYGCSDDASSTKDAGAQGGSHATPRADDCPEKLTGAAAWKYDGDEQACAELGEALTAAGLVDAGAADGGEDDCSGLGVIEAKREPDGTCGALLSLQCDGRSLGVVCENVHEDGTAECVASVRAEQLPGGECVFALQLGAAR